MLFICDNQGIPLSCSRPLSGRHHDSFGLIGNMDSMLADIRKSSIATDGLFLNADSGFDSMEFRTYCASNKLIANIPQNKRNNKHKKIKGFFLVDKLLEKRRFVIERTNAWIDSFKALLTRFETLDKHWKSMHHIAFSCIILRKL